MTFKSVLIIALLATALCPLAERASAQTAAFTTVSAFPGFTDGSRPAAALVEGDDGNYYGTTTYGGLYGSNYEGFGTFFQMTPAGAVTVLHTFDGTDGVNPSNLIKGSDGNFYGVANTLYPNEAGTLFKITPAGVLTTLYKFSPKTAQGINADGYQPIGLTQAADGNFYGVTKLGGKNGNGTIFQLTPGGTFTTIYTFSASTDSENSDGFFPTASLVQGTSGDLYGTAQGGGANTHGTIFRVTYTGNFTTLYTFAGAADGSTPSTALVQGSDGNFYGTNLGGKIFRVTPAGVLTPLHAVNIFEGSFSSLVQGSDGNFYGTITKDSTGNGTVFKVTPAGAYTDLHDFASLSADGTNVGGADPMAALLLGSDGNFYGSTYDGGSFGVGTIFKMTSAGTLTDLHDFSTANAAGAEPRSSLLLGASGILYGTAPFGGANGQGTAFQITPGGVLGALTSFSSDNAGGYAPEAPLIHGPGGNFYGSTYSGGANGLGTIFQLTPGGALTTLASFSAEYGAGSAYPLTLGRDGNVYGTTEYSVFKVTPSGTLSDLYEFSGANGDVPNSGLFLAGDGNFYGTTYVAIYQITPAGARTTLYTFPSASEPTGGVIQATDGNFYGVTSGDGTTRNGTIYRLTPAGVLTILYNFSAFSSPTGTESNSDGAEAQSVIQGSDGNFYGTTYTGGPNASGVVFQLTPSGVLTNLHSFSALDPAQVNNDGGHPNPNLIEVGPGDFYGTASDGGANSTGTIFALKVSPAITSAMQATAYDDIGFTYQITASNGPTSFAATGLPTGLSIDTSGKITGQPTEPGVFSVSLSAGNAGGTGTATLTLTVEPPPPVITSAASGNARAGQSFTYKITATNQPTSFGASSLPAGVTANASTGLLSGTPTVAGSFSIGLHASNAGGTGVETLALTVAPAPPVITSATSENAIQGKSFSYQIAATYQPTSFGENGLPAGLSINATTGLISGTPSQAGTFSVKLRASNSAGSGLATLMLAVASPAPMLTSPAAANGEVGQAFSYQITATNQPTSFGENGLPAGLTISGTSGLISGTPTTSGSFTVTLRASNASGSGLQTLNLTISAAGT
jgi:uncharacterized repeat protein (TIGR03803 family)